LSNYQNNYVECSNQVLEYQNFLQHAHYFERFNKIILMGQQNYF